LGQKRWKGMAKYQMEGCGPLVGSVSISGSKNATLPLLAACLLTEETCILEGVPPLLDVFSMIALLEELGVVVGFDVKVGRVEIKGGTLSKMESDYETAGKFRASFLVMGPLLARSHEAKIPFPGGCAIGSRPVDLHCKGFSAMGAKVKKEHGYVCVQGKQLKGNHIYLDFPSVGATENIMMAATLAIGITVIENAAAEPEIVDLAEFLREMGAKIEGDGTNTITIEGVKKLMGAIHRVIPDRIEAGTFMVAAAITGGDIILNNVQIEHLNPVIAKLKEGNVKMESVEDGFHVYRKGKLLPLQIKTLPFPGFPTDMQAPMMSLLAVTKGTSIMTETVFENRFSHAGELKRMGADITIDSRSAVIQGVDKLMGAKVVATDLRAGAALVLSALVADGKTEIGDIYHIERGYDQLEKKLCALGAKIVRLEDEKME